MVKVDSIKKTPWRRSARTYLSYSPTNQGIFRHSNSQEEVESKRNSTLDTSTGEKTKDKDGLNENEILHEESESKPRTANQEFKDIVRFIVSRVFSYCRGKELFIFGLVVTICLAALCFQLTLLRKSLHEARTEQMGDIINKLITENEHFKSEVLAKIRDIDEGLKNLKFESLLLNINAFHQKLLKELKERNQEGDRLTNPDEASISDEDNSAESLVGDTGGKNKDEENGRWKEIVKNVFLSLLIAIVIFLLYCYYIIWKELNRKTAENLTANNLTAKNLTATSFTAKLYKTFSSYFRS